MQEVLSIGPAHSDIVDLFVPHFFLDEDGGGTGVVSTLFIEWAAGGLYPDLGCPTGLGFVPETPCEVVVRFPEPSKVPAGFCLTSRMSRPTLLLFILLLLV